VVLVEDVRIIIAGQGIDLDVVNVNTWSEKNVTTEENEV
jgi:hypothetical protein